ncbi:MAG: HAD family hydrolase [Phycisphaerales bacterium]|nr:HAD family hydrolase [Phycisphaerales bacterium]
MVRIPGVQAVVFDLDDTLYPEKSFVFSGFEAVAAQLGRRVPCPFDAAARMRLLFEQGVRGRIFDQLLAEMHCAEAADLIPLMIEWYRTHWPSIELFVDAERALNDMRSRFRLALVSDGPLAMQRNKVSALGLADRLDLIILTDQWGREFWKPHPRAFETIQNTWGLEGPACLYVADNVEKDFLSPLRLGWRTVRVHRQGGVYENAQAAEDGQPEFEAGSLSEIELTT